MWWTRQYRVHCPFTFARPRSGHGPQPRVAPRKWVPTWLPVFRLPPVRYSDFLTRHSQIRASALWVKLAVMKTGGATASRSVRRAQRCEGLDNRHQQLQYRPGAVRPQHHGALMRRIDGRHPHILADDALARRHASAARGTAASSRQAWAPRRLGRWREGAPARSERPLPIRWPGAQSRRVSRSAASTCYSAALPRQSRTSRARSGPDGCTPRARRLASAGDGAAADDPARGSEEHHLQQGLRRRGRRPGRVASVPRVEGEQ